MTVIAVASEYSHYLNSGLFACFFFSPSFSHKRTAYSGKNVAYDSIQDWVVFLESNPANIKSHVFRGNIDITLNGMSPQKPLKHS